MYLQNRLLQTNALGSAAGTSPSKALCCTPTPTSAPFSKFPLAFFFRAHAQTARSSRRTSAWPRNTGRPAGRIPAGSWECRSRPVRSANFFPCPAQTFQINDGAMVEEKIQIQRRTCARPRPPPCVLGLSRPCRVSWRHRHTLARGLEERTRWFEYSALGEGEYEGGNLGCARFLGVAYVLVRMLTYGMTALL